METPSFVERGIAWIESRKSAPPPTSSGSSSFDDILAAFRGEQDTAGEAVNRVSALQVSAVAACARVISEGMAQVSCRVMREDTRGSLIEARDHPLFRLLNRKPNDWQTSFELREQIGLHLAIENNAYVYLNRDGRKIGELYAFEPHQVEVRRADDLTLTYRIKAGGRTIDVPAGDIWHLRGPSWNGWKGDSAIARAKRTIGLALATERFGAKLYENGARPGGILTTRPGGASLTAEQRTQLKEMWQEQYQGTNNAHKTALLPFDLDFTSMSSTANDAQWIESRRFLIEEVCRHFRVQPIMVMQTGATSYASVEQLFLNHFVHTLMPWFERFEQSADAALLTPAEIDAGVCIKLNHNALLRGSTAERTAYYQTMVTLGVMSLNDVRVREDMPLSDDPEADKLRGAANLFGNQPATATSEPVTPSPDTNEVSK